MKKTLVIVAHPNIDEGSVSNKVIIEKLEKKEGVTIRNISKLYGKEFLISTTVGGEVEDYESSGTEMSDLLKPLEQTAKSIGMNFNPSIYVFGAMVNSNI